MHKNYFNSRDKPYRDQHGWSMGECRMYWSRFQNVRRRRHDKRLIHYEKYEEIRTFEEPRDWWLWD